MTEPSEMTWRERARAFVHLPGLIRLVWASSPRLLLLTVACRIGRALIPLAMLWTGKLIIDRVVLASSTGAEWRSVMPLVTLELVLVLTADLLARLGSLAEALMADDFSAAIATRMMEHAGTLDLATFEDPAFNDHLERARKQTRGRVSLIAQVLDVGEGAVTFVSLTVGLAALAPWLLALLCIAVVPGFLGETRVAAHQYSLIYRWTERRRQLDYLQFVASSATTAKEVHMLGLVPWLVARYRALAAVWRRENRTLVIRRASLGFSLALLGAVGYYAAYAVLVARAVDGVITIGTLAFLSMSFARSRDVTNRVLTSVAAMTQDALYLRDLFAFLALQPTIRSPENARKVQKPMHRGLEFENVAFRYPGRTHFAVRNVCFTIRPGERIALVGENGAGKTTLTKLCARLYDPSEGRVLLDGVDLREYDLMDLRQRIGVVFQDFVRYDMRLSENVGVGSIGLVQEYLDGARGARANGYAAVPDALVRAAGDSAAADVLERLPNGWDQMLGRRFSGGVELSGGEWQRIALARAWMRDAQLIILDEPTAALDARAERDVVNRCAEVMRSRMALIVSHRFSTVRMADRIVVMSAGAAVEYGPHDALMSQRGLYSELFAMQASAFQ